MGRVLEQVWADLIKEAWLTKLIDSDSREDTEIVTYNHGSHMSGKLGKVRKFVMGASLVWKTPDFH